VIESRAAEARRAAPDPAVAPSRPFSARRAIVRGLPYVALLPTLVTFLLLLGYPVLRLVETSLQHWGLKELFSGTTTWVGLANYGRILADPEFLTVLVRTFLFTAACVGLTVVLGMLVALLLDRLNRVVRLLLSVAMVLAWATPVVTGVVIFQWLFDSKLGVVNWAISSLGFFGDWLNHSWFETGLSTFAIIVALIVWQAIPFVALSLYAGLLSISRELLEAARVDGASERQLFWHVTLPSLRPLLLMLTFLSVIWDFKVYTQVYAMRQGGPDGQTVTLSVFSYITGISQSHYDIAASVSMVMVALLLLVLIPYIRTMIRSQEDA
jgi:N,N'-diacetylchitobiose transport system permease protein